MWTCASEPTERSAKPNQRPSRNSLKPCFVESRSGTRATEPASCPYDVGVDEVRVQDPRANACEVRRHLSERDRIDVRPQPDVVERDAALAERVRELPRPGLVLVEHEEADVPAALAQVGEQLQEMGLRAGDARDLLRMEHDAVRHESPAASRMPRAHDCTE